MTPDEQVTEYMKGWHIGAMSDDAGANLREHYDLEGMWTDAMRRGFEAARTAAKVAERCERERIEKCPDPNCELSRGHSAATFGYFRKERMTPAKRRLAMGCFRRLFGKKNDHETKVAGLSRKVRLLLSK